MQEIGEILVGVCGKWSETGSFPDTHARNPAKTRVTVSFWDVIGLLRGHICKNFGKYLYVLVIWRGGACDLSTFAGVE